MTETVNVTDADTDLAECFWRVHPSTIRAAGITRIEWYAKHIAKHRIEAIRQAEADKAELVEALAAAILEHDAGGITLSTAKQMRQALAKHGGKQK